MTPATGRPHAAVVLAAVDDSVAAVAVARAAGESALARGAQVVVFTAVGVLPEDRALTGMDGIDAPGSVACDADAALGLVRPVLDRLGVNYRTRVGAYVVRGGRRGRARRIARAIQRGAESEAAALIVVGHASGRRSARSSVAGRLLPGSAREVLVVPLTSPSSPTAEAPTANPRRHDIASAS